MWLEISEHPGSVISCALEVTYTYIIIYNHTYIIHIPDLCAGRMVESDAWLIRSHTQIWVCRSPSKHITKHKMSNIFFRPLKEDVPSSWASQWYDLWIPLVIHAWLENDPFIDKCPTKHTSKVSRDMDHPGPPGPMLNQTPKIHVFVLFISYCCLTFVLIFLVPSYGIFTKCPSSQFPNFRLQHVVPDVPQQQRGFGKLFVPYRILPYSHEQH